MYDQTKQRYGGIDILYNNAGISPGDDASILETEPDAWDRVQAVNTRGVYLCCKHGIPHLLERGGGSVINVASFVALVGAATSQISYTASKGAVLALTRELECSSPERESASMHSVRAPWRRRSCSGSGAMILRPRKGDSCICRWAGWQSPARSSTLRCFSQATSRPT